MVAVLGAGSLVATAGRHVGGFGGQLADVDRAAGAQPPFAQEPAAWRHHRAHGRAPAVQRMGGRVAGGDQRATAGMPAWKEGGRGVRVDPRALASRDLALVERVLHAGLEDVNQGATHFGRLRR